MDVDLSARHAFEDAISTATQELQTVEKRAGEISKQDVDQVITDMIRSSLRPDTWSPVEKANGIMVLFDGFRVDERLVVESSRPQSIEKNIDVMFQQAVRDVFRRELSMRSDAVTAVDVQGSRVVSREYPDTPLATRIGEMPKPGLLIRMLFSEVITAYHGGATVDTAIYNVIDSYRSFLWETLDPAQQVHLMIESDRGFDGAIIESDQWPGIHREGWETVIASGHLWHHLYGILSTGLETRKIGQLPPRLHRRVKEKTRLLTIGDIESSTKTGKHVLEPAVTEFESEL